MKKYKEVQAICHEYRADSHEAGPASEKAILVFVFNAKDFPTLEDGCYEYHVFVRPMFPQALTAHIQNLCLFSTPTTRDSASLDTEKTTNIIKGIPGKLTIDPTKQGYVKKGTHDAIMRVVYDEEMHKKKQQKLQKRRELQKENSKETSDSV